MSAYCVNKEIKIHIPKNVQTVLRLLKSNGFEAFVVGGCVRDSILNRNPEDWDITTSATPAQIKDIFHKTIDTGIEHGTVTVRIGGEGYEVTTYRIDGEYTDHRHPEKVQYTRDLKEDLKRRDFTINAMAYDPEIGLVDMFGGMEDIKKEVIACVGNPQERFEEDALRILRAVRFAAQLGFEIVKPTKEAACQLAFALSDISAERIRMELEKLILSDNPEKLLTAYELGITKVIFPEFDAMMQCEQNTPYHCYNVGKHTVEVMKRVPQSRVMRWAALLHDVAKPESKITEQGRDHFYGHAYLGGKMSVNILKRLKMDNKTIKVVARLVAHHADRTGKKGEERTPEAIRRSVCEIGKDIYSLYLELIYADLLAKSEIGKEAGYRDYLYAKKQYGKIVEHNICTSVKELAVSGKHLIQEGCPLGVKIGEVLEKLLDIVLKDPEKNTTEQLLAEAKHFF